MSHIEALGQSLREASPQEGNYLKANCLSVAIVERHVLMRRGIPGIRICWKLAQRHESILDRLCFRYLIVLMHDVISGIEN